MYIRPHYIFFDQIRNQCDGLITYVTPSHLADKEVFLLEHIRPTIENIINPQIIQFTSLARISLSQHTTTLYTTLDKRGYTHYTLTYSTKYTYITLHNLFTTQNKNTQTKNNLKQNKLFFYFLLFRLFTFSLHL